MASLILSFGCAKEPEPKAAKPAVKVGVSLAGVRTKTWLDPNADESGKSERLPVHASDCGSGRKADRRFLLLQR